MGLKEEFDWSAPPPENFKTVKVPDLVASSYSSSCDTVQYEDLVDTAVGPATTNNPDNAGAPPSTWNSSGALVLSFDPFGHLMTKGEKSELDFRRVYTMGVFLSCNSRSSETFIGSSCNLKPDGALILLHCALILLMHCALILLMCYSACLFLINITARMLNFIRHHISSCISNSSYYISNACMNYKI